jgi:hypothetical protein
VSEDVFASTRTPTQKDDGSCSGNAPTRIGNGVVTYDLIVTEQANIVAARRTKSIDGNDCNFIGDWKNKSISGQYFCKNGGPYNWSAEMK